MKRNSAIFLTICLIFAVAGMSWSASPPHTDYRTGYAGGCGNSAACHTVTAGTFLPASIDNGAQTDFTEFCLSCHNAAGEAHERSVGSASTLNYVNQTGIDTSTAYSGNAHSWNGITGNAGTRTPTLMGGTFHMPNGTDVTCQVCHEGMDKIYSIENIDWALTTTSDNTNYVIMNGDSPYANTKQYLAKYIKVYRSASLISRPSTSRAKKAYRVAPSEYTYNYANATITFLAAQTPTDYIFADIGQPYFRDGNASNIICLDCHNDRADMEVTHSPGTGVNDHHPVATSYGHVHGLTDTLKPTPSSNIYIDGGEVLCTSCHDPHNSASDNGYILRNADASALCADCHMVNGFDGYTTATLANHFGAKHSSATVCLDCHDPHNTNNILLVREKIGGETVNFQNFSGPNSFGNDTGDSICETCHTATTYHLTDSSGAGHNTSKDCTQCHAHSSGFGGGGCTGCHGFPPVNGSELVSIPAATGSATEGAHNTHVFVKGFNCDNCHSDGMVSASEADYVIEMGFTLGNFTSGVYDGQSLINGYSYDSPNTSGGTKTCSSVYCHGGDMAGNGGIDTTPVWDGSVACGDCHGADGANPPTFGSHSTHASSLAMGYACTLCHAGYPAGHVNADSEVALSGSDTRTASGSYSGTAGALDAYGDCSNIYCHSDGTSDAAPFTGNTTPSWGGTLVCGDCHNGDSAHGTGSNMMASGSHTKHASDYLFDCVDCHNGAGTGTSAHADMSADLNINKTLGSKTVSGTYDGDPAPGGAYGSCDSVYCHSNADPLGGTMNYSSVTWGGGALGCTSCHGYAGASGTMSPSHPKHIDTYGFACTKCHTGNTHVSGDKDVNFDGVNASGSYSSPDCSGIYCHSSGTRLTGPFDSVTTAPNRFANWTATLGCNGCHGDNSRTDGMPAYADGDYKSNSHPKHVVDSSYTCDNCHNVTTSTGNTITTTAQHADNGYDVDMDSTYGGSYDGAKCNNTACHGTASPDWGGSTTCSSCHTSQSAGTGTAAYNGSHELHASIYGLACESCHARMSASHTNTTHADIAGKGEVKFTDKGLGNWSTTTYGGGAGTYKYRSMYASPYGGTASPDAYTFGATSTADANNANVFWSDGSCGNVWCHSNANPVDNAEVFASPSWGGSLDCQSCHGGDGATGTMSTRHAVHVDTYGLECVNCHVNTVSNNTTISTAANHVNGAKDVFFDGNNGSGSYASTVCSDLRCHSDGKGTLGGSDWDGPDATCTSCHGHKGSTGTMSAAHAQHVDTYSFGCTMCHTDTVNTNNTTIASTAIHVNFTTNVAFDGTNGSGGYTSPNCSTLYCHGDGNGTTGGEAWNSGARSCNDCHNYTPSSGTAMASGKHINHIDNGNLGVFECNFCHARTVAANNTTIQYANGTHVDTVKTVALSYNSYTGFYTASNTCQNVYCHSSGQINPAYRTTPDWTSATTLDCDGCHGAENTVLAAGAPEYANVSTADRNSFNGHQVGGHVGNITDCVKCHNTTVDGTQNILATGSHLDGTRTVSFQLGGSYDDTNKRCSGTDTACHGGDTMRWGGTGDCMTCHSVSGIAETDDYNYGTAPRATVNFEEWTSAGHGSKSAYRYTGNAGANRACEDCHSPAVAHGMATNPFRLTNADTNALCATCHTSASIKNHEFSVVGQGTWGWSPKCVDCHDPHGDTGGYTTTEYNGAMIHSNVSYTVSNTYGVPGATEAVDFPANYEMAKSISAFNWSSFVDNGGANKGICRVCHTEASTTYFTRSAFDGTHQNTQGKCTSCHIHSQGFAPSCDSCHGYPPNATDNKQDNIGAVGAHDKHVNGLGLSCFDCHKGNSHNQSAVSAPYTSIITPGFVNMSVTSDYALSGNLPSYNGTPGAWTPNKTCSTSACHYDQSPSWDCQP